MSLSLPRRLRRRTLVLATVLIASSAAALVPSATADPVTEPLPLSSGVWRTTTNAHDGVMPFTNPFRMGVNPGYPASGWGNEDRADLVLGNPAKGIKGVNGKTIRLALNESVLDEWGYDLLVPLLNRYRTAGVQEMSAIVGFPGERHRDTNFYCPTARSQGFANIYEPVWVTKADGSKVVNPDNYYAEYLFKVVSTYKTHVKFWEIWNEPGFDYTGQFGWRPPEWSGNWWLNNPDPCHIKMQSPIQHYIRLLRISWDVIKTVDPSAYVLSGGIGYPSFLDAVLRQTDNPDNGKVTAQFPFTAGAYFDGFSEHVYSHIDGSTIWSNAESDWITQYARNSDGATDGMIERRFGWIDDVFAKYGYGSTYQKKLKTVTEQSIPRKNFDNGGHVQLHGDEAQVNTNIKQWLEMMSFGVAQTQMWNLTEESTASGDSEFGWMGAYPHLDGTVPGSNVPVLDQGKVMKTFNDLTALSVYDDARTIAMNLPANLKGKALKRPDGSYIYAVWARTTTDLSEVASGSYTFPASMGTQFTKYEWDYGYTGASTVVSGTNVALTGRPIFLVPATPTVPAPQASFGVNVTSGSAPLTVAATSTSTNATSLSWSAPGASPATATGATASFVYSTPGTYVITLTASGNGTSTATRTITVATPSTSAETYLEITNPGGYTNVIIGYDPAHPWAPRLSPASGQTSLSLRLRNLGAAVDWSKVRLRVQGDNNKSVMIGNYIPAGTNTADWFTITVPISAFPAGAFDNMTMFSLFNDSGSNAFKIGVSRIVFSGGVTPFVWYGAPEKTNNSVQAGGMTITKKTGTVTPPTCTAANTPVAAFGPSTASGKASLTVQFTNSSQGATSYSWSFPGGSPATSTAAEPTVRYDTAGSFSATLVATSADGCSATTTRQAVQVQPADPSTGNALTLTYTGSPYKRYEELPFKLTVKNTTGTTQSNVVVKLTVPAQIVHAKSTPSQGSYLSWLNEWRIGTLAPGQTVTLDLNLFTLVGGTPLNFSATVTPQLGTGSTQATVVANA